MGDKANLNAEIGNGRATTALGEFAGLDIHPDNRLVRPKAPGPHPETVLKSARVF